MKIFAILAFSISIAISVSAQATTPSADEAGLKIMKVDLQRTAIKGPTVRAVAPTDPAYQKNAKTDRIQDSDSDSTPALHRLGENAELAPKNVQVDDKGNPRASRSDVTSSAPTGASIVYVGSVVVKNIGTKTVTAVRWEFLLFDTNAKDPSKRYSVQSKRVIPPGEQTELTKEVTRKGREYQARLVRIDYSDGSFWEQSQKPGEASPH